MQFELRILFLLHSTDPNFTAHLYALSTRNHLNYRYTQHIQLNVEFNDTILLRFAHSFTLKTLFSRGICALFPLNSFFDHVFFAGVFEMFRK